MDLLTVHKDILRPGTYTLPNGLEWTCSPGDVRNACAVGNRMLEHADALAPPLIWEHDWNTAAVPLRALLSSMAEGERRQWSAGYAANAFGHATRFYLRDENGAPALWSENRIAGSAGPRFEAVRYVSPRMDHDYRSGDGVRWHGATVQHIAATPRPIQLSQMPVMLSGAVPGGGRSRRSIFVNRAYLGDLPMAEDKDGDKGDKGGEGKGGDVNRLITSLTNAGINLPDGITSVDELCIAVDTYAANNAGGLGGDADGDPLDDLDNVAPAGAGGMGAMLSGLAEPSRAKILAEVRKLEPHLIERGVLTVPQLRALEAKFVKAEAPVMLSALAGKPVAGTVAEEWETAKNRLRAKLKPGGGAVKINGKIVQLSDLQGHDSPNLEPDAELKKAVEAERERVKKDYSNAAVQMKPK